MRYLAWGGLLLIELLRVGETPAWFEYPPTLLRIVRLGLVNIEPWAVMPREQVLDRISGLTQRYPERDLVPFARRTDCDDLACFEKTVPRSVTVIHDFAKSGWEQRDVFPSFQAWFRAAIDDFLNFEPWIND
jgi:hypothetical protein